MFKKKNKSVQCPFNVLVDILNDDLNDGLCTDITFTLFTHKHRFGAYGDGGETRKNVKFYLDDQEYNSKEELLNNATLFNRALKDCTGIITVIECNGCYPDSEPRLKKYM